MSTRIFAPPRQFFKRHLEARYTANIVAVGSKSSQLRGQPDSGQTPSDYALASNWLNSNASAFVPENASWITLEELDELSIQAADIETLPAMKIAAERDKDTLDIARLLHKLNITNATDAVDLAYAKYGNDSIPLAAGRDNYLIVVDDALDAATTLPPDD